MLECTDVCSYVSCIGIHVVDIYVLCVLIMMVDWTTGDGDFCVVY